MKVHRSPHFASLGVVLALIVSPSKAKADEWSDQLQTPPVQKAALGLAREAMRTFLSSGRTLAIPTNLPPALKKRGAVFVTIEKKGQIKPRGCRGTLQPITSTLAAEIIRNSIAACTRDKTEPALRIAELPRCLISLTVVLRTQPIDSIGAHDADNNGLIARSGSNIGIVLPYEGHDALTQEKWAKRKAGLGDNAPAQLLELFAVRFRESDS